MWAILKIDKKNLSLLKNDFYNKLGNDVKFYIPMMQLKKSLKRKTFVEKFPY